MKTTIVTVLALLVVGCAGYTPSGQWYVSHATAPSGGHEWHSCKGGYDCMEGYACVKDGCEWCGGDDVETRCTAGND